MRSFLIVSLFFLLLSSSCKKNPPQSELSKLPLETQTGANTFGCLVNGQAFLPAGSSLSGPNLGCIYQYLINGTPAGFTFALSATNKKDPTNITTVGFGFDSVKTSPGLLLLKVRRNGEGGGQAAFYNNSTPNGNIYKTNSSNYTGELWLKKFDEVNQIASGTFWFTAVNPNGDTVKVTEGRFDVHFTR